MRPDHQRFLLLFAAIVIAAWGVLGFFDRLHIGRGGFTYSPAYVINYVAPEGPGERAGLRVGPLFETQWFGIDIGGAAQDHRLHW